MKKSLLATTVVSLISAIPSISYAQDADETMVVTANRFEQSADSVLAPVSIVTRDEIELMQAKSLPDVLKRLPGVEVTQNGGRGQSASVFVRGTGSDQVLFLIDGVRMAKSATGAVDFNQVPVLHIERVEYIRGARASMYGSEAIGGVINIITSSKSGVERTNVTIGTGSRYNEANLSSSFSTSDNGRLRLTAGYEKDDGYNVKPVAGGNDGEEHGFSSTNGTLGYDHVFQESLKATVFARAYRNYYQYDDGSTATARKTAKSQVDSRILGGQLSYSEDGIASSLQYSNELSRSRTYNPYSDNSVDKYSREYSQDNLSWINSFDVSDNTTLSGGLDWRNNTYDDKKSTAKSQSRSNLGFFAGAVSQLDKLTVELSGRLDDNEDYGKNTTYSMGAGYSVTDFVSVFGSYGTAFKAPTLSQQNGSAWVVPNKDLKPETSDSIDFGLKGMADSFDWAVTVYDIRIQDLISYNSAQKKYENVDGETRIRGVELEAGFETGVVSHNVSVDIKDPKDSDGKQLQRRAKETYKWSALVSVDEFDWSLSAIHVGERRDIDYSTYKDIILSAYTVFDASVTYHLEMNTQLRAKVDNLFDEDYQTANGYPSPGRSVYLSLSHQF